MKPDMEVGPQEQEREKGNIVIILPLRPSGSSFITPKYTLNLEFKAHQPTLALACASSVPNTSDGRRLDTTSASAHDGR